MSTAENQPNDEYNLIFRVHDNLYTVEDWSEEKARERARAEGIELTKDHIEVLKFLRDEYEAVGRSIPARKLLKAMEERFADKGGRRYLYNLFPGGPVTQGSRIAGLPAPVYATDPSFGSVE